MLYATCWEISVMNIEICKVFARKGALSGVALGAVHKPYHHPWQPGGLIPAP